MALIGKIREKSGLLLIVVGVAMLAFIMGGWDSMFGGYEDKLGIGTVYGEKIDQGVFSAEVQRMIAQDQQQAMQSQREYTPRDQQMSADRAWNNLVDQAVLQKEFEALGIQCSENELNAYLYGRDGFDLLPDIAASFKDSVTGQFNARMLEQRIDQMENSKDPQEAQNWQNNKLQIIEGRKQEKYYQLLNSGVYVTKLEAKEEFRAKNEKKNIAFVMKRFIDMPDDEVKVTDEMVRDYYDEHKSEKRYEQKATREVKYFDIPIRPSSSDSSKFNTMLTEVKNGFETTKNDSTYVLTNSEIRFFTSTHQATFKSENDPLAKKGLTYPAYMDTLFKTAEVGQVVGPYNERGKTRLAKVLDFNTKLCKVRHLLIGAPKGDEAKMAAAQKKADSLLQLINKDNFEEYILTNTDDRASIEKLGVYEDFLDYEMVAPFSKFAKEEPIGKIGTVRTDFGIHIIEVLDRKEVKYPVLAIIEKTLKPSNETTTKLSDEAYDVLYSFDEKISRKKVVKDKVMLFDSLASKNGYFARPLTIMDERPSVQGFKTSFAEDRILKMAFSENAQEGDLCSSPIQDQDRYVIAILTAIRPEGEPRFEDVEERMRYEVIKDEKAKKFEKMMANSKSLDALARKLELNVEKTEILFSNPQIQKAGYEPEIVGAIYSGLKDGQISVPLKGQQGMFVIQVLKTEKAGKPANYKADRDQLTTTGKSRMQSMSQKALREKAEVIDNRRLGALGIRRDL
ncbi:MAG: hypothetical protein EP338_07765 [Bacteroidetes bacterium]|nr:MAG: hypothetical protein EP338_07765 [Bacteroidota bacterium]